MPYYSLVHELIKIDHTITYWFERGPHWLHPYMLLITQFGNAVPICILAVIIAILAWTKHQRSVSVAFLSVLPAELIMGGLKLVFNRSRPDTVYARTMLVHTNSFPSGHALGSIVIYGLLAHIAKKQLPKPWNNLIPTLLILLIALIGISRVYLGAHWSLDVIGGWIFGGIFLWIIIKLTKV